mmetsp:Transcript_22682/g.33895  ORF Transcript_22682/g.33895 Transcript_22682/m.33895 type:complete len:164 (+) Transcript_22682:149-640(+)
MDLASSEYGSIAKLVDVEMAAAPPVPEFSPASAFSMVKSSYGDENNCRVGTNDERREYGWEGTSRYSVSTRGTNWLIVRPDSFDDTCIGAVAFPLLVLLLIVAEWKVKAEREKEQLGDGQKTQRSHGFVATDRKGRKESILKLKSVGSWNIEYRCAKLLLFFR